VDEARAWGSWIALSGQLNLVSEWLPKLPPDRLEVVKRTIHGAGEGIGLCGRPVDLFEQESPRIWRLSSGEGSARRDVVGFFNWDDKQPQTISVDLSRLDLPEGGKGSYAAFDFWENTFLPVVSGTLKLDLRPGSCRVIALRRLDDHPVLVSTSRHVTQGIVDVADERWDATTHTLSGASRVIGGDAYELRIALPAGLAGNGAAVSVSDEDRRAGVTAAVGHAAEGVRATISAPENREVRWEVRF
jgi:hypothetical protein